jgi:hypothetical protein
MKKKKIFGIGAVILMISIAFMPVINGMQLNTEEVNTVTLSDEENEYDQAGLFDWDLKVTFNKATFDHYSKDGEKAYWEITYTIANIGTGIFPYIGKPGAVMRVPGNDYEITAWKWPEKRALVLYRNHQKTITTIQPIDYDREIFAMRTVNLETGLVSLQGVEDPQKSNNVDSTFGKFWEKTNHPDYDPSGNHLEACRPHEDWIDHYETVVFPDEDETSIEVPVFKDTYSKVVIPRFFGCDRMGWLGQTVKHLINVFRATLNLSAYNLEVLAGVTLLMGELYAGIMGVIALIEGVAAGSIVVEAAIVAGLFIDLAAICVTLELLLAAIVDLDVPPEFVDSVGDFLSFMSTYPWTHDITIFGEVNNCFNDEKVTVSCRDVENRDIPGGAGKREIESFEVDSKWSLKDYRDSPFHLFFRNCQVTVAGDKHQTSKSLRALSYVAPGGSLQIIAGLKEKSRSVDAPLNGLINRILELFPLLKQILSPFFSNPLGC